MTVIELDQPNAPLLPFAAGVATQGTSAVVTLRGEADFFTLPVVVEVLARVISEHDGPVIVDLAKTSFIDGRTLCALGRAAGFLASHDRTLTVREPSSLAVRLLDLLGLAEVIQQDTSAFARAHQ